VLIEFDKVYHFLPGFVLANVFADAHLAALALLKNCTLQGERAEPKQR
jgi:hypothetical protein